MILRPETNLTLSPKKIKVDPDRFAVKDSDINVKDVDSMAPFKRVSLYAKVVRVDEAAVVSDGLKVQNVIITDANRAIKMALWENDIGRLSKGKSYHLVNVVVNSFQGANFLQFPKGGAEAHEVKDIGTVAEDDVPRLEDEVHDSEVAGVLALDYYVACLSYKSKVDKKSDVLGTCSKCGAKLLKCSDQKRARLVLTLPGGGYANVNVFGKHLEEIAGSEEVTEHHLLAAKPFSFTYANNIVDYVYRKDASKNKDD